MSLLGDKQQRGRTPSIVAMPVPTNGDVARVYVFDEDHIPEKMATGKEIFHCLCCMFAIFSFGIMLGWPSPTYPDLLDPIYTDYPFDPIGNFTIPSNPETPQRGPFMITLIESPLVAGLLMFGVILATPYSSHTYMVHSIKHGLLMSLLAMILGWVILWQAANVFHLLVSRLIIGLGNGFAVGQVKIYIQHTILTPKLKGVMTKMINIVMLAGVFCAFVMGVWLNFHEFAIGALVITTAFWILTTFLPLGNLGDSKIEYIGRTGTTANQPGSTEDGIWKMLTLKHLKKRNWILIITTFIQQFSGAPATIVYTQVLLFNMGIPTSSVPWCAVIYLLVYIIAYSISLFYLCTLPYSKKRFVLICSIVMSSLSLLLVVLILHFNLREYHLFLPLIGLCVYIFMYGLGLGTIPNTLAEHLYEPQWRRCAGELQLMCFSLFAVIITKLLQVFLGEFPLECIFYLHISVAIAGLLFVLVGVPSKPMV